MYQVIVMFLETKIIVSVSEFITRMKLYQGTQFTGLENP